MTPKLNVWRLQSEKRRGITVLVLRDQHGNVKQVAKGLSEQAKLKKWWEIYNKTIKTQELPVSKKLRRKLASDIDDFRKRGFIHSIINYGIRLNRKTGKREYKRMEVLKATPWTHDTVAKVRKFFKLHPPKSNLGVYAYHGEPPNDTIYMHPPNSFRHHIEKQRRGFMVLSDEDKIPKEMLTSPRQKPATETPTSIRKERTTKNFPYLDKRDIPQNGRRSAIIIRPPEITETKWRKAYRIAFQFENGEQRRWSMNNTSFKLCLNSFGGNELDWVGKSVSFRMKRYPIHVGNKVKYVTGILAEPVK